MIKMIIEVWRRKDLTPEQFETHWRGPHADLVRKQAPVTGARRYVQNYNLRAPEVEALAKARGWSTASPDGVAELWYDSVEALIAARTSPEGLAAREEIMADEALFCDGTAIRMLIATDREVFDFSNG